MLEKLNKWFQSILPEKWKGKNGVGFLMFMWVVIIIFEVFWFATGNRDPYAIYGMPAFFAILTFIIGKWSLKIW